jgi:hypothetical protein
LWHPNFRSIKKIYIEAFRESHMELPLMKDPATEEDGLLNQYIDGLASFLAKHGTLRQSVIPPRKLLEIGGNLDGKEKGKEAGEEVAV